MSRKFKVGDEVTLKVGPQVRLVVNYNVENTTHNPDDMCLVSCLDFGGKSIADIIINEQLLKLRDAEEVKISTFNPEEAGVNF